MLVTTISSIFMALTYRDAGAHFTGEMKSIDGFQIIFAPYPISPRVNQSSTLGFSVLDSNGANIFNTFSALTVKDRSSGETTMQFPYKFYEFSDMSFPLTFTKKGEYEVVLETRISGHDKYQRNPIVASFVMAVADASGKLISFDELIVFYVTPPAVVAAIIAIYLDTRGKRKATL